MSLGWRLAAVVTFLAACLPAVLWPGDVSWMNDEPNLIAHAFHANERHVLADEGLLGSFGIKYGPLPTQVYQAMLLLTHDPVKLVAIHALLCSAVTALALLWLARTLRLTPWFAAAVLLAPYLWLYQRTLWDATFTIPLGRSRWRRTPSFLRTGSGRSLVLAVGCAVAMPFIHPQGLPLFAAILGHLVWWRRFALGRHRRGIATRHRFVAGLNAQYVFRTTYGLVKGIGWFVWTGHGSHTSRLVAALSPFVAGHLLTAMTARRRSEPPRSSRAGRRGRVNRLPDHPPAHVGRRRDRRLGQWRLWRERRRNGRSPFNGSSVRPASADRCSPCGTRSSGSRWRRWGCTSCCTPRSACRRGWGTRSHRSC